MVLTILLKHKFQKQRNISKQAISLKVHIYKVHIIKSIGYLKIIDDTHYEWYDGYSDSTGEHIDSEPMKSGTWTIGNYYGGLGIFLYSEGEEFRHWVISDDYNQLTGDGGNIYIRQ